MKSALLFWILSCLQEDAKITRGPYLQNVTPTSIVVCWRTHGEVEGEVEYGETTKLGKKAAGSVGGRHEVELPGLKPGTVYHYRVGTESGRFRTAPREDAPITFLLYGDDRSNHKVHAKLVTAMATRETDLILHSGDLVENGLIADQWRTFFQTAAPLLRGAPFYPSLGNHERNAPEYFDSFLLPGNERYYSFDYGPAHFLILDSNSGWRQNENQIQWLKEDLAATKQPFKFAVFHHPILSTSASKSRTDDSAALYRLWGEIFEKGGLTAALQGHNHNYQRAEKNGVVYLTSGGGGAPLYPVGESLPETQFQKASHHFVSFRVESKRVMAEAIDLEGKVLDRFTLKR